MTRSVLHGIGAVSLLSGVWSIPSATAQRAEAVQTVRLLTAPTCLLTPDGALTQERNETVESAILATLVGGVVGDLVGSGLNALGEALENASKEKGIVAEGVSHVMLGEIRPRSDGSPVARFVPVTSSCLILYTPGSGVSAAAFGTDPALDSLRRKIAQADGATPIVDGTGKLDPEFETRLQTLGIDKLPGLYVEAQIWSLREGLVIRPSVVWYREKMPGAPTRLAASELHVSFATPAAPSTVDIGSIFAGARMLLPKVAPGTVLDWDSLRASTSIVMPGRPTTGYIDTQVAAANTLYTTVGTRKSELRTAERAYLSAKRKHDAKPTAETQEALDAATIVLRDARLDLEAAEAARDGFTTPVRAGATNVKLRFVVIREPNQFGLALAKALKGRSAATGTAVGTALTDAMSSKPAWTADDTGYVQALNAVEAKQREYDAAVTAGDSAAIAAKADELRYLKAKLNEAAVKLKRPIPYPSLY